MGCCSTAGFLGFWFVVCTILAVSLDDFDPAFWNSCHGSGDATSWDVSSVIFIVSASGLLLLALLDWTSGVSRALGEEAVPLAYAKPGCCQSRNISLHWNNLWVTLYGVIYAMGFHATLLGFRIYGEVDVNNYYTRTTCSASVVDIMRSKMSMQVFLHVFSLCFLAFLFARKGRRDPYSLASYCTCPAVGQMLRCRGHHLTNVQTLLQIAVWASGMFDLVTLWTSGLLTPKHFVNGLLYSLITLWVLAVLWHVLQIDVVHWTDERRPPLDSKSMWAVFSLFVIWTMGILFYLSVFGVGFDDYLLIHALLWAGFVGVSSLGHSKIFPPPPIPHTVVNMTRVSV